MMGFTRYQARILAACLGVYLCAYIGRLNISAALGDIIDSLEITAAQAGLFQTLFAVTYAAGQLVFGSLADRVLPRRLLLTGLVGSACVNGIIAASNSFAFTAVLWTLNGVFQSMLWTPIVRLLAQNFEPSKRKAASLVMSFALAGGHFFAWLLSGGMARLFSWRMSFAAPCCVLLLAALGAYFALPGGEKGEKKASAAQSSVSIPVLLKSGLMFMLLGCVCNGFVRDSVITWGPTILGSSSDSLLFTMIIPVINLFGIALGAYLVRHVTGSVRRVISGMMAGVAALSVIVTLSGEASIPLLALLLGLVSSLLYGSNPLITTLTPLEFDWADRVGLTAGLIDCSIYIGSALSGTLVGSLHDKTGTWSSLYPVWILISALGALSVFASAKSKKPN